jgi:putative nucleotidyltransferase with HDIG domain
MTFELTRDHAWNILTEHTKGDSLRKHALAVEAAVCGYAHKFGEDEEVWSAVALLHDFDYELYPDLKDHPFRGAEILRKRGCPEFVIRATASTQTRLGCRGSSGRCLRATSWQDL